MLILFLLFTTIVFAKVEKINDEFDGTYYYQTESFYINDGFKMPYPEIRFRTTKDKDNHEILIELNAISDSLIAVDDSDRISIKCNNGNILVLNYKSKFSQRGDAFSSLFQYGQLHAIRSNKMLTDKDIENLKSGISMIKIETQEEFININVNKKNSDKLIKILNEIINKLNEEN